MDGQENDDWPTSAKGTLEHPGTLKRLAELTNHGSLEHNRRGKLGGSPFACADVSIIASRSPDDSGIAIGNKCDVREEVSFGDAHDSSVELRTPETRLKNDRDLLEELQQARSEVRTLKTELAKSKRRVQQTPGHLAKQAMSASAPSCHRTTATKKEVHGRMKSLLDEYPSILQQVVGSPSNWSRRESMADGAADAVDGAEVEEDTLNLSDCRRNLDLSSGTINPSDSALSLDDQSPHETGAHESTIRVDPCISVFCAQAKTNTVKIGNYKTFSVAVPAAEQGQQFCLCFCTKQEKDVAFSVSFRKVERRTYARLSLDTAAAAAQKSAGAVKNVASYVGTTLKSAWSLIQKPFTAPAVPRVLAGMMRRKVKELEGSHAVNDEHRRRQRAEQLAQLCTMGFEAAQARMALAHTDYQLEMAVSLLVSCGVEATSSTGQFADDGCEETFDDIEDLDDQLAAMAQPSDRNGGQDTPNESQRAWGGRKSHKKPIANVLDVVPLKRVHAGLTLQMLSLPVTGHGEFEVTFFNGCEATNEPLLLCFQTAVVEGQTPAEEFFAGCLTMDTEEDDAAVASSSSDASSSSMQMALKVRLPGTAPSIQSSEPPLGTVAHDPLREFLPEIASSWHPTQPPSFYSSSPNVKLFKTFGHAHATVDGGNHAASAVLDQGEPVVQVSRIGLRDVGQFIGL